MGKSPKLVQSIERSAALLEIIAQEGGGARLRDLAAISGLGKTTAHNILQTLEYLGYVHRRSGDMRYHLGGRILNLARIMGDDHLLRDKVRPILEAIARDSKATVYLGVPSGDETAYLDIVDLEDPNIAASRLRNREKLEGSAVGLVFLAFVPGLGKRVLTTRANALNENTLTDIENVRIKGYALDLEAYHPGVNAVAIPLRESGEVRASIAVAGPAADFPRHRLIRLAWIMMKHVEDANIQ
ncbi:IclR family transcriptional regulator [Gluconobacter frateurii]|uniref:IclR family transcriptional regulator n=1 Tax=Gluconobacter frateurii TaxID=38308 RepID=UPI001F062768|nr:IclR family transcriptional regulator [Gluconobacter frateurii]UMM08298.1 IclR family transcriptional regulator [Gluconobacter frateurii]